MGSAKQQKQQQDDAKAARREKMMAIAAIVERQLDFARKAYAGRTLLERGNSDIDHIARALSERYKNVRFVVAYGHGYNQLIAEPTVLEVPLDVYDDNTVKSWEEGTARGLYPMIDVLDAFARGYYAAWKARGEHEAAKRREEERRQPEIMMMPFHPRMMGRW